MSMDKNSKIYIAGHQGMVGSSILRNLKSKGYTNLIGRNSKELDLRNSDLVRKFFEEEKPDYVFLAAARVGGIYANNEFRGEFIYDNLSIQNNVIHHSYLNGVKKLLFLGSSCIYPKKSGQPIKEEFLLTGPLEPTNEPYAIAKISGIKMCESYFKQYKFNCISIMPTNLYGSNDNFDLKNSHVLPALLRKFHEAKIYDKKEVEVWGTGKPLREFLHVDDLANGCIFLMNEINCKYIYEKGLSHINIGSGEEISIMALAELIKKVVDFKGELRFNSDFPDGMYRKLLDSTLINDLGWSSQTMLEEGIHETYNWYKKNIN